MGTWPIYKNTSYNWSKQKKLSFNKISAENPVPDNSPQSIGELRNGHVANLQELYYMWYKILMHVLIV